MRKNGKGFLGIMLSVVVISSTLLIVPVAASASQNEMVSVCDEWSSKKCWNISCRAVYETRTYGSMRGR